MKLDPINEARVQGAKAAIEAAAAEVANATDPVAIRRAVDKLWTAGHTAYQATIDAENATRRAALVKLGEYA